MDEFARQGCIIFVISPSSNRIPALSYALEAKTLSACVVFLVFKWQRKHCGVSFEGCGKNEIFGEKSIFSENRLNDKSE